MEYNTTRNKMIITEYGRNIQKMIEYALTIEDREKRNRLARVIISVMGQLNPQYKDVNDYKHKLWDHLHIMADYKLDVDSPFPKPTPALFEKKEKKRLPYPKNNFKYRHFGKNIELIIDKVSEMPDGEEKNQYIKMIASQLKKSYLAWNRESVTDEIICDILANMSSNKLMLAADTKINHHIDQSLQKSQNKKNQNNKQNKQNNSHNSGQSNKNFHKKNKKKNNTN